MSKPRRAHKLALDIQADSIYEMVSALANIQYLISTESMGRGCSGGPGCGYTYEYSHDPEWTHDRYFEALKAELADREGGK